MGFWKSDLFPRITSYLSKNGNNDLYATGWNKIIFIKYQIQLQIIMACSLLAHDTPKGYKIHIPLQWYSNSGNWSKKRQTNKKQFSKFFFWFSNKIKMKQRWSPFLGFPAKLQFSFTFSSVYIIKCQALANF